jgi:Ni/Co efflux regulator RcnB
MKWFVIPAAAALGLALAAPALAAPAQHDRDRDRDRAHQTQPQHSTPSRPGTRRTSPTHTRPAMRPNQTRPRYDWNKYKPGHRPPAVTHRPRLDLHIWHRNFNAPKRFHWRPYRRPHGWYYRRWTFGMILPNLFWGRDHWITDYWNYGLADPPYGYVWVRYGDDALLVNVTTGYVLQAVYGLFY